MPLRVFSIIMGMFWAAPLHAAETGVLPPKAPFIAELADSASWEVSISYPDGIPKDDNPELIQKALAADPSLELPWALKPLKARHPARQVITVTGALQKEEITYHDSEGEVRWVIDGLLVSPIRGQDGDYQISTRDTARAEPFAFRKYEGFDWLAEKNYRGVEMLDGRRCWVFRQDPPPVPTKPPAAEDRSTTMPMPPPVDATAFQKATAWIDVETRKPVRLVLGTQVRDFKHLAAPTARLDVPKDVARAWALYAQPVPKK
jgi:hypothetical protein